MLACRPTYGDYFDPLPSDYRAIARDHRTEPTQRGPEARRTLYASDRACACHDRKRLTHAND